MQVAYRLNANELDINFLVFSSPDSLNALNANKRNNQNQKTKPPYYQ